MKNRSKRYQKIAAQLVGEKTTVAEKDAQKLKAKKRYYTIPEAITTLKAMPPVKFDATVELAIRLGVDTKKSEQAMRGSMSFPKGIGKTRKVIVFAAGKEAEEARLAGADEVGLEELIKKIEGGWTDFDVAIAPPNLMKQVSKLGKVLGPAGKMPSPKTGTVTDEIKVAVKDFKAGKTEYRTDADGNIHMPVGRVSFTPPDLEININTAIEHIKSHRPTGIKGDFIRSITISSTMGPGLAIKIK
ncbi:MAG TPA: 50S ribosomal protein L1 [Planctomycetota bacterium]|nr:50S ribosomal protein L1 [Planctomycetota bacterium]